MSEKTNKTKKQIVVVGGGFGGLKAALDLSRNSEFHVTLISDKPYFRYNPTLYHTATGGLFKQSIITLKSILEGGSIEFVEGEMVGIDSEKKTIALKDKTVVDYDTAVLALGSVANYFGIKGMQENSYSIKSLDEVARFKEHLHRQLEDDKKPDLNYIIVGAGPTGIELAGVLPNYIRRLMKDHGITHRKVNVTIVEASPRLLPRSNPRISRAVAKRLKSLGVKVLLGKSVQEADDDSLLIDGKDVPSKTIIWTAGTANHPFYKAAGFELNERGKVKVDEHLMAKKDIYVIGDNADTPFSGMAQTALHDALYVTHDIEARHHGNPGEKYTLKTPAYVIPVGHGWAAFEWKKIVIIGKLGWVIRQAADWVGFSDIEPWWKATKQWATEFGEEEDCATCLDVDPKSKK